MPRIKRYWPCSHGFNRDPEIHELRKKYADWMGYVWQEMCAMADLNDGEVKGSPEQIGASLAYISLTKRPSLSAKCITNALGFMEKCGWIAIQTDRVLLLKYLKYHHSEYKEKVPPNDRTTERPNIKNPVPATPAPTAVPEKTEPRKLNAAIKAAADPIYKSDPEKFARLIVWIKEREKRDYPPEVIVASLKEFWRTEQKSKIRDWWPYLNRIFTKEYGQWHEAQSAKHKAEDAQFVRGLVHSTARLLKA